MDVLRNAPRKRFSFVPRTEILESEKMRAWPLSDGRFFGFCLHKDASRVSLFTGPTEMFEDSTCQISFQIGDWECFTNHCVGLVGVMNSSMVSHPESETYYISIVPCESSEHCYGLKISRIDGSVVTIMSMVEVRFEPSDGDQSRTDSSFIKLMWNDWKENMRLCCTIVKQLIKDVYNIKRLERLKMRLNDYYDSLTNNPFAEYPEREISIVYVVAEDRKISNIADTMHVVHHQAD